MTKKLYTEEFIQDIAEAIREKGIEGSFKISEMGNAIRNISGGDGELISFLLDADQEIFRVPGDGPYTLNKYGVACGNYKTLDFSNIDSFLIKSVFGGEAILRSVEHLIFADFLTSGVWETRITDLPSTKVNILTYFPNAKTIKGCINGDGWSNSYYMSSSSIETIDLSGYLMTMSYGIADVPHIENCSSLKEVILARNMSNIQTFWSDKGIYDVFPNCPALESITIPYNGVCSINDRAIFPSSLITIYVNDNYVTNYSTQYGSKYPGITFKPISDKPQ